MADTGTTVVMFRKWRASSVIGDGIIALFPYEPGSIYDARLCQSFEHIGQHGGADLGHVIDHTWPASPDESAALRRELESAPYGYRLRVCTRTPNDARHVREMAIRAMPREARNASE